MTRIELVYPKIPDSKNSPLEKCIAFEKYDGTNLHWVWEPELGWYAFGTRRHKFDLDRKGIEEFNACHPGLEEAPSIFMRDFARPLEAIFKCIGADGIEITVFTEFLGEKSFAGMHQMGDRKRLVLFDVQIGSDLLDPEMFARDFCSLNIAKIVYRGKLTGKFMDDVRQGKYGVAEGVVCKGKNRIKGLWMVKIKTNAYMNQLKQVFNDDWESYWE